MEEPGVPEFVREEADGRAQPPAPAQPPLVPVVASGSVINRWKGLRRCLTARDGFLFVPAHPVAEQLLLQCQRMAPCVLILEASAFGELDPSELAAAADYGRLIRVLVVGSACEDDVIQAFVRMGCMGFLSESASAGTLRKAVLAISRGELWIDRRLTARIIQQLLCSLSSQKLTPREKEILRLIARGLNNRAIAGTLAISHETVRWHIRSLHTKLGLQDRPGTALYARTYLGEEETQARRPAAEPDPALRPPPDLE